MAPFWSMLEEFLALLKSYSSLRVIWVFDGCPPETKIETIKLRVNRFREDSNNCYSSLINNREHFPIISKLKYIL